METGNRRRENEQGTNLKISPSTRFMLNRYDQFPETDKCTVGVKLL